MSLFCRDGNFTVPEMYKFFNQNWWTDLEKILNKKKTIISFFLWISLRLKNVTICGSVLARFFCGRSDKLHLYNLFINGC